MLRRMKVTPMADKERKVIKVAKNNDSPLRSIFCLKNRANVKEIEEKEECFILEFDPYDSSDYDFKLSISKHVEDTEAADSYVIAEKGQVACRDYPHSRHTCAKYPFDKTDHETHCELCYCYVCDIVAPCDKWAGTLGHCHAFNGYTWNKERRLLVPEDELDFYLF